MLSSIGAQQFQSDAIDAPKPHRSEVDLRVSVLGFKNSYYLTGQRRADKDQFALPLDLAVAAHPAQLVVGGIVGIFKAGRIAPRRGRVMARRRSLAERFVRPLLVELGTELIQAALLGVTGGGRWAGALGLERAMHPFVTAVLLRLAGCDALGDDPQLDPPHRQSAQSGRAQRGERRAIVGADG